MPEDQSGAPSRVGVGLAFFALASTRYGYLLVGRWMLGSRQRELRRRVRAGDVFDHSGYGLSRKR